MGFIISLLVDGNSGPFDYLSVTLTSEEYSNTRPGIKNYISGQSFLKYERVEKFLAMYQDADDPYSNIDPNDWFPYVRTNYTENFDDGIYLYDNVTAFYLSMLEKNDGYSCLNNTTSKY